MKRAGVSIVLSALIIFYAGGYQGLAEVSKELSAKKDITNLDWGVLRAQIDIENGIALHNNSPELDKWKLNPSLRSINTEKNRVIVNYDIPNKVFNLFSTSEKENQFEKIIVFTIEKVKNYLPTLERDDFVITFYRNGVEAGKLENNHVRISGTTPGTVPEGRY
ncbi:MAG TPA: hypothetical protein PKL77_08710 [Candidatus Omnitrophota bacterium]|nr:hypothetical protein [Candidatus Omnitrophota bacterium]HPT07417.1 hypothetical protein [Candidatus Omnitrophota bacterium]